ncbi:MAG: response regulator [Rhodospirillales bacterium]|nr:response regulator [Rhodospirillales bacterium]
MDRLDEKILDSKILIVDDTLVNITLLVDILGAEGYRNIFTTTDPREVETFLKIESFDLILLDIHMPEMSGIDVLQMLQDKQIDDYQPVLVLTAQTDDDTRRQALSLGAKDFLNKPFDRWEVLLRIRNLLETWVFYNRQKIRGDELEARVQQRTRQLNVVQDATIVAMGSLAETRDNETGNHIRRTQRYIRALAEKLGGLEQFRDQLTPETITLLFKSAPLHDIGKVGIPDRILLKPGRLDPDEFEIMKTHARLGEEAIEAAEGMIADEEAGAFLAYAREIAIGHHEKWDGSGYPAGLSGGDIPLSARLMAVADVYDALISRRVYKPPFTHEETVAMIEEGRGSHFDPVMVDAFLEIESEFRSIAEKYSDDEDIAQAS